MTSDLPNAQLTPVREQLRLNVRHWPGEGRPFVLLHGLASNSLTWAVVARHLQAAGHAVYAVDQRGHGPSDKPDDGYDFGTVTEDLALLLDRLALASPIVAGQSWGGNVVLEFGARYPKRAAGLVMVDGGYLDLQARPDVTWEKIADQLRPPPLAGTPRSAMRQRLATFHPDWTDEGIDNTMGNYEVMPDDTIRPWLTLERHMRILRSLWDQRPPQLYVKIEVPVLIAAAEDASNPEWMAVKHRQVAAAAALLPQVEVRWFGDTAHDIHVHRPRALAELMLEWSKGI
ncbi:MAG: alpha/beta hydrolase [Caldilineaceae bacterium]